MTWTPTEKDMDVFEKAAAYYKYLGFKEGLVRVGHVDCTELTRIKLKSGEWLTVEPMADAHARIEAEGKDNGERFRRHMEGLQSRFPEGGC